jgi:hypothetical protein
MYTCEKCDKVVGPKVQRQVVTEYREDGNIAKEVPVCGDCWYPTQSPRTVAKMYRCVFCGKHSPQPVCASCSVLS